MRGNGNDRRERELVRRTAEGDRNSFRTLYDTYKDRVYSTCIRMLGNELDAEEALQDVFVRVYTGIGAFKGESSFSTWLYRIAVNVCIERLRRRKRPLDEIPLDDVPEARTAIWDPPVGTSFRDIVEREIANLPDGYRAVFVLCAVEGYKHREIADMLGIAPGTSKSQYFQARERLRKNLLPYLEVLRYELQ